MENEITNLENMNRQLECRGFDFECKFYSTLEEKLLNDKEYEQYLNDKNDMIERLNFDIEEIRREVDTKDEIIRKLKRQLESKEKKVSIFNNTGEGFSNTNIPLNPILINRNSNTKSSLAFMNMGNLGNFNINNNFNDFIENKNNILSNNNSANNKSSERDNEVNIDNNNSSKNNIDINLNNLNYNLSMININANNNKNSKEDEKNNTHDLNNISSNNICNNLSDINDNNRSNINNSKISKNYADEDIHELNINAISAKIDDVLNNSLKDYPLNFIDKSNINTNNNTPINNKLNNSNEENEEKEFIRQIIDQEVKNILENRKTFILSTLAQENFSFDYVNLKMFNLNDNINKRRYPNKTKIIENIDDILLKIQARREKVMNQKKLMINKLEKMGIKIF